MMLLHQSVLLLFFVLGSSAQVITVTSSAEFSDLKPAPSATYQYLWYVRASNSTWDCMETPGVCTSNCGTSTSNGPQCALPVVPSNSTFGLDLNVWPTQVRWGKPLAMGSNGGVGVPSGFGFRGTALQPLDSLHSIFWIGEAVHFNNVIYARTEASSWVLIVKLSVLPNGHTTPITATFRYPLTIEETNNACKGEGCPWSSSWWAGQSVTVDTRQACPENTSSPALSTGENCCRYRTDVNKPCADKVWTLDVLDQTAPPIDVNGVLYTLQITGFSVPNMPNVQKTYFISQEGNHTLASIYARLITACPSISDCPSGQSLVIDSTGTRCVCSCPADLPTCPNDQFRGSTCACQCPDSFCSNGGLARALSTGCQCDCSSASCSSPLVITNTTDCSCGCPPNWCGQHGFVSYPSDPTCACTCTVPCQSGQIVDTRCNCSCPSEAYVSCIHANGTFDEKDCSCSIPCNCLNTSCQTQVGCDSLTGECIYEYHTGAKCDGLDLCLGRCGPSGSCIVTPIDCSSQLVALVGEHNATCYQSRCDAGTCHYSIMDGASCGDGLSTNICVQYLCSAEQGGCIASPVLDGTPCDGEFLSDQCNKAQCRSGECVVVPLNGTSCSDGNPCTIQPGSSSDVCASQSTGPSICIGFAGYCDAEARACNSVQCIIRDSSPVCLIEPLPFGTTCDDHNACTLNDVCQSTLDGRDTGVCAGSPISCDSGAPCILATCQPDIGCVYDSSALDGVACNSSTDACVVSTCTSGLCNVISSNCNGTSRQVASSSGRRAAMYAGVGLASAAVLLAAAVGFFARKRIQRKLSEWSNAFTDGAHSNVADNPAYQGPAVEAENALYQAPGNA